MVGRRFCIRVIVADVFVIFRTDFGVIEVVDKFFGQFFISCSFGNGKSVGPDDGAFFGNNESDIGVFPVGERGITGPHHTDPCFFGNKFLFDCVRIIRKNQGRKTVKVVQGFFDFLRIFGIDGAAPLFECHTDDFPIVIQQNEPVFVVIIPEIGP